MKGEGLCNTTVSSSPPPLGGAGVGAKLPEQRPNSSDVSSSSETGAMSGGALRVGGTRGSVKKRAWQLIGLQHLNILEYKKY